MMNFPHMIPYNAPYYFALLIAVLLPMILTLAIKGTRQPWCQTLVTLVFLYISFGGEFWQQGVALIVYVIHQTLLTQGYVAYRKSKNAGWVFYLAVFLAILPPVWVKVPPFVTDKTTLLGFLGISYLTLKAAQVVVDLRGGVMKEYHPFRYIQFLLFFLTISPGSIDHYRRFEEDLKSPSSAEKYLDFLEKGIFYLFLGFLYRFITSYYLDGVFLPHVEKMALAQGGLSWWTVDYMYNYSLHLFFDFAGYSLLAVGTSYLMGYDIPMNFSKPFLSRNIKEFWNRWHTTLSFWFRDYIYMRLVFFLMKKKVFKSRIVTSNIGCFALFLIVGIWHGLMWFYIAYGLYHATLICVTDAWLRFKKKHKDRTPSDKFTCAFAVFLTFQAVCVSFLTFSGFLDKLWSE